MCVAGDAVWARDPVPMAACRLWVACGPVCRPAEPAQLSVTSGPCSSWREGLAQGAWRGGRETWSQQASPPATTEEARGCCQALHRHSGLGSRARLWCRPLHRCSVTFYREHVISRVDEELNTLAVCPSRSVLR